MAAAFQFPDGLGKMICPAFLSSCFSLGAQRAESPRFLSCRSQSNDEAPKPASRLHLRNGNAIESIDLRQAPKWAKPVFAACLAGKS